MDCYSKKEDVVIIIDEAHTLGPDLLEEVRLLTNLENPSSKLLQVILLGQPELDNILNGPNSGPSNSDQCSLPAETAEQKETEEYIKRRLRWPGPLDAPFYTGRSSQNLSLSKGVPG